MSLRAMISANQRGSSGIKIIIGWWVSMKTNPFNKDKFKDILDKLEFFEREGIPPEVVEWADFQRGISIIERRKSLDDGDILCSLINLFRRIDVERLTDKDVQAYAAIADRYGVLTDT
jgi:hypothetical protein